MLQSCQAAFRLMQELERRVIPEESLNNNQHMSIINIISNDELTLVQGVNGPFLLRGVMGYAKQGSLPYRKGFAQRNYWDERSKYQHRTSAD